MNFDRRAIAAPTRELANWIAHLRYEDLPQRTREVMRIAILDTVGAGVYGYSTPWAQMLLEWARRGAAGAGEARVWGEATPTLRCSDAALVNGTASHEDIRQHHATDDIAQGCLSGPGNRSLIIFHFERGFFGIPHDPE